MWIFYHDVSSMTPVQSVEINLLSYLLACFALSVYITVLGMRSGVRSE